MTTAQRWDGRTGAGLWSHAWFGLIGEQDRAGVGAQRAHRTRGDSLPGPRGDVWRVSDLRAFGAVAVPGHIVARLRAFDRQRSRDTRNGAPGDADWRATVPALTLADGEWAKQKWHTVAAVDAPQRAPRPRPRGYVTNGTVPTIPPRTLGEWADDIRDLQLLRARSWVRARRIAVADARRRGNGPPIIHSLPTF